MSARHSSEARTAHPSSRPTRIMACSLATAGATYAGAALTGRRAPAGRVALRGSSLKVRAADASFDPRTFRRELSRSGNYNRKFLKDEDSAKKMEDDGIGYSKSE